MSVSSNSHSCRLGVCAYTYSVEISEKKQELSKNVLCFESNQATKLHFNNIIFPKLPLAFSASSKAKSVCAVKAPKYT